ncbi:MAG: hypothetical protein WC417_01735 [Candidatus Omnitrophota bacterium]
MRLRTFILSLFFVFTGFAVASAAIIVENRTGAVKIFTPDGKQLVIQANDPLPEIPEGSAITMLAGSATVITTGDSTVMISVGTYSLQVKENSKVNLVLNPDGTMSSTVIAGETLVSRKVEAYESPRLPPAQELGLTGTGETGRDISPSQ